MDDFPNAEDEFELLHADELELMQEMEDQGHIPPSNPVHHIPSSARRQLTLPSATQSNNCASQVLTNTRSDGSRTASPTSNISSGDSIASYAEARLGSVYKRKLPVDDVLQLPEMEDLWDDPHPQTRKRRCPLLPEVRSFEDTIMGHTLGSKGDPNHDSDRVLMERIMRHREQRRRQEMVDKGSVTAAATMTRSSENSNSCRIYRRIPDGGFQAVTNSAGQRLYLSMTEEEDDLVQCAAVQREQPYKQLLSVPFQQLKEAARVELQQQAERVIRASDASVELVGGVASVEEEEAVEGDDGSLWTDLYRPAHYLHLLSDEMTNRTVLYWIKMWDKYVFGVNRKLRKDRVAQQQRKKDKWKDGKFNNFFAQQSKVVLNELRDELDGDGRPAQKLVLLSGAPGLGKTTLAHIIARHAGYRVVELNASDDRSVDAFRSTLESSTSMRAVLDKDRRPNCLVIDEIDGAPAPSIKLLVNLLTGKGLGGASATAKKKGAKQKVFVLQRPVIAICNDLYAPALRPLRQLALVVTFPPTLSAKLAQRLLEISLERGLRTDLTALLALTQKTHNDIRSCLALLQFVRRKRGALKLSDIEGVAVGQKDYQQSLFAVWNNIFSIPKPVKARHPNPHDLPEPSVNPSTCAATVVNTTTVPNCSSDRCKEVLQAAMSCSEYDRLMLGWFENYPTNKFKHTHLEPVTSGLEWAGFLDILYNEIHSSQSWILQGYIPHSFVALHLYFASHQRPKITYPVQHTELTTHQQRSESLLSSLMQQMSPTTRIFLGPRLLVTDLLPYICTILQPNFRPVNTQLYSSKEKAELFAVINTMLAYNLTYTQEQKEGQYSFVMEPNIEEVVLFTGDGDMKEGRKQLSYTARQLVAREVEMEKVRRSEAYFSQEEQEKKRIPNRNAFLGAHLKSTAPIRGSSSVLESSSASKPASGIPLATTGNNVLVTQTSSTLSSSQEAVEDSTSASSQGVPNHLRKLVAKPVSSVLEAKLPRDFFGRIIQPIPGQEQIVIENDIVKSDIWFRFKEGYSSAVRRPIKMRDLK